MRGLGTAVALLLAALLGGCSGVAPVRCLPIQAQVAWGALSGLTADGRVLYAVHDHNLPRPVIYRLIPAGDHARLEAALPIRGGEGLDPEGLAWRPDGGFWLVSEGSGHGRRANLLVALSPQGEVLRRIPLPRALTRQRVKGGLEGVAVTGSGADEQVWLLFQRPWRGDPANLGRLARYTPATGRWLFFGYPLDAPGNSLSGLTALPDGRLAVIERDSRPLHRARIKRIYAVAPVRKQMLTKTLLVDLLDTAPATCGTLAKFEGLAVLGQALYLVADDDGEGTALLYRIRR